MCPNCALNQAGLNPAYWGGLALCGFFFLAGIVSIIWAARAGLFKDIEKAKYRMMDEGGSPEKTPPENKSEQKK